MCAIAGMISKKRETRIEPERIEKMILSIKHRGPNETGYYITEQVHLAMARLSIIDLRSEGLCPIVHQDASGDQVLLYNGELYNYLELREELRKRGHTFKTGCDSEVLLESYLEWGQGCLDKFNGMFAFAIADFAHDLLFAARDRAGEKPFYYCETDDEFIFGSEIKALLTQIRNPEISLTDEYEAFEYMSGEGTLFAGVKSLLPGHKLVYRGISNGQKGKRISEYWNVLENIQEVDPAQAVDQLDELLQDSVRLRRRADVPMGLYLSGGIDSGLLAYMARPEVCYSCHFPFGEKYDELAYAVEIAKDIQTEHIVISPTKEDFERYLPSIMCHLDMPVGSFSMFPLYMLAQKASELVKIVMSGEGADELFSGYVRYLVLIREQALYDVPELRLYKSFLTSYLGSTLDRFARLLNRGKVSDLAVKAVVSRHFEQFEDLIHAMGYTEFKTLLVSLLQMGDRTAAAFGLENRSPYLDHRIIEFAFSIPSEMKIRECSLKWILRQVAARYLPKRVLARKDKMGLIFPVNIWYQWAGKRGEFDRRSYNHYCMAVWRRVFFATDGRVHPVRHARASRRLAGVSGGGRRRFEDSGPDRASRIG
jgi:asparagine synthase (glutamine-hydrolysing)